MDFGAPSLDLPPSRPEPVRLETPELNVNENSLNFEPAPAPAPAAKAAPAPAAAAGGMMEFDLGGLSLDLPPSAPAPAPAPAAAAPAPAMAAPAMKFEPATAVTSGGDDDSPLATKLALAEEFNAIGDADGARSLAEEVLAEASGDLKSRAQRLLAEIG
jgi:pilus assembly protein FimV